MVDARRCGSPGNATPTKEISLRRGEAHPAKNVLGSVGVVVPSSNQSERDVSPANAICIRSATFSSCELVTASWSFRTRSGCSSAAMRLSSSSEEGGLNSKLAQYLMKMGKDGQQASLLLTGVPYVHGSHKSRRRGDPNTMYRHLLHTCTSVTHFQVLVHCSNKVRRYQSNTSRRISSVRISTTALWRLAVIKV